jgi:hypothetical protein
LGDIEREIRFFKEVLFKGGILMKIEEMKQEQINSEILAQAQLNSLKLETLVEFLIKNNIIDQEKLNEFFNEKLCRIDIEKDLLEVYNS